MEEYALSDRQSTGASDRAVDSRGVLVRTNDRLQHFWRRTCRIGMAHEPADDFDHPNAPALRRRHVLYRIKTNELPNNRLQPTAAGAILSRRG